MNPLGFGDPLRLGPYRLLGVLGEGGMGKVYVGQDGAGILAAVKVLRPELAHDTGLAQRFVREAQTAQAVRSPGVAAVLGAWTEGGRPWIATEFLAGLTLDQAVDTYGPLDEPALRALAASLARTLADIHAAGLIHRDLKPPNIVLTSAGPRIIDFGIARPEHGLTLTTTGQIPVTPGYGAPEQALGQRVAAAADVFSLGAVLAYAASGRRAFDGTHVAVVQYEVVHGAPDLAGLPEHLRTLLLPCLAKDPAQRPTPAQITAAWVAPKGAERAWRRGHVADAIKEREKETKRLTTTVVTAAAPPVSRRGLLTGLAAGGTVLAAGGGSAAWWLVSRNTKQREDPFTFPAAAKTPKASLRTVGKDADGKSLPPEPLWGVSGGDVDSPALLPVRDVIVLGVRDGGIGAYDVVEGERRWQAPEIQVRSGYLSLSDRLVAAADADGVLRTYVASTGEPKWTADADADLLLAADSEAVYVVTKDDRLRAIDRSTAKTRWTTTLRADFRGNLQYPAAVSRGRLVMTSEDGGALVVNTTSGKEAWARAEGSGFRLAPAVHDDVVILNGETLTANRLADGKVLWRAKVIPGYDYTRYWGPPTVHSSYAYSLDDGAVTRLDIADGSKFIIAVGGDSEQPAAPVVQGNAVWFLESHALSGVDLNTEWGNTRDDGWSYTTPEAEYRLLAADGNRVFIMDDDAFRAMPAF